jgi:hypothetical protein
VRPCSSPSLLFAALVCLCATLARAQDGEIAVDLELVIAVDVSASMDHGEFLLQRSGYASAIVHPDFLRAIRSGFHQRIAVTYVEWSSRRLQATIVPWRTVDGLESATAFARELESQPIESERQTSISAALRFSAGLFAANGYDGTRKAIDVSGDGPNNSGPPVAPIRDRIVAQGIVINGLPILIRPSPLYPAMDRYYADCVIGGAGSFMLPVRDLAEFAEAIRHKLLLEIAARPPRGIVPVQAREPVDCLIGEKLRDLYAPHFPGLND